MNGEAVVSGGLRISVPLHEPLRVLADQLLDRTASLRPVKLVLDTNVLVSGIFWGGVPGKLLDDWVAGEHALLITPPIMLEYSEDIDAQLMAEQIPTVARPLHALGKVAMTLRTSIDLPQPNAVPREGIYHGDDLSAHFVPARSRSLITARPADAKERKAYEKGRR